MTPYGWGEITGEFNNHPERVGWWEVTIESGRHAGDEVPFRESDIRHETFREYCSRPTGFGKTPWVSYVIMQLFFAGIVAAGISTWNDNGWTAVVFVAAVQAVILLKTFHNYTNRTV